MASETFRKGFSIKSLKFIKPLKLLGPNLFFILECLTRMPTEALRCIFYWFSIKKSSRIPFHWYSFWGWYWLNLTFIYPYCWYYLSFLIKKSHNSSYYNFGGYDSFAHAFGNYARPAQKIIHALDKQIIKVFEKAVRKGFLPILFSDHGMTPAAIFQKINGKSLKEIISHFVQNDKIIIEEYPLTRLEGPNLDAFKSQADIFISSSGPISLVYFIKDSQRNLPI